LTLDTGFINQVAKNAPISEGQFDLGAAQLFTSYYLIATRLAI